MGLQILLPRRGASRGEEVMTEEELLQKKRKTEGARIGYTWLKRHLADFDRSEEKREENWRLFEGHNLELSEENLVISALVRMCSMYLRNGR